MNAVLCLTLLTAASSGRRPGFLFLYTFHKKTARSQMPGARGRRLAAERRLVGEDAIPLPLGGNAAAQHFIQGGLIVVRGLLRGDQRLLRRVQRALRVQQRQVAVHALAVTQLGQAIILLRRRHIAGLRRQLFLQRGFARQRVGGFLKCCTAFA